MNDTIKKLTASALFVVIITATTIWLKENPETSLESLPPTASGVTTLDIMVLYNQAADDLYNQDAITRINHLVDVSNQIYQDSGANLRLRLVHSEKIDYESEDDSQTAMNHLTHQTHPAFNDVLSLKEAYGADLTVLMRPYHNDGYCGLAWVGGYGTEGDFSHPEEKNYAFSQVSIDCGTYVLAHELGHNMGLNHSRRQDNRGGTYEFSLGHGVDNEFVTVMAYSSTFNAQKTRLFSNPALTCGNSNCGVNQSSSESADAVYTLNHVAPQIAQYYASTVTTDSWAQSKLDSDGNGLADVVLRHEGGEWSLNSMQGEQVIRRDKIAVEPDINWQAVGREDYDGDGRADLLMRHGGTGQWHVYLLNGNTIKSDSTLNMSRSLAWEVQSNGDYDGDGKGDVLIRNANGRWYIYFLDGLNIKGNARLSLPEDVETQFAASGDYDGDGKSDLLIRQATGGWEMFLMDGGTVKSSGSVALKKSLAWTVASSGDFNGDETDDLLMRYKNGSWLVYQFDGFKVTTQGFLELTTDLDWQLASAGDFNGDGMADLLMRNSLRGNWQMFTMDNAHVSSSSEVALTDDLSWLVPQS
ncbi:MAG: hypothetical protein ACJAVI_005167 [Candidatus Azotimanducaceae bacterium]|jgi:hypothetical protein